MAHLLPVSFLLLAAREPQVVTSPADVDVRVLAERGETQLLRQSIDGRSDVDWRDICYRTPLMLAAGNGQDEVVRLLTH